jgi:hypothetical protein
MATNVKTAEKLQQELCEGNNNNKQKRQRKYP